MATTAHVPDASEGQVLSMLVSRGPQQRHARHFEVGHLSFVELLTLLVLPGLASLKVMLDGRGRPAMHRPRLFPDVEISSHVQDAVLVLLASFNLRQRHPLRQPLT